MSIGASLAPDAQRRRALRERLGVHARALLAALEHAWPEARGCGVAPASRLAARALAALAARRAARAEWRAPSSMGAAGAAAC